MSGADADMRSRETFQKLEAQIEKLESRVEELETTVNSLHGDGRHNAKGIDELVTRVEDIENDIRV